MDIKNVQNSVNVQSLNNSALDSQYNQTKYQNQKTTAEQLKQSLNNMDKDQLENLFKNVKEKFDYMNEYLKIEIDKDLHEPIVKIVDKKTDEVIRQIPPENLVELAKKIDELVGLLFNKEV